MSKLNLSTPLDALLLQNNFPVSVEFSKSFLISATPTISFDLNKVRKFTWSTLFCKGKLNQMDVGRILVPVRTFAPTLTGLLDICSVEGDEVILYLYDLIDTAFIPNFIDTERSEDGCLFISKELISVRGDELICMVCERFPQFEEYNLLDIFNLSAGRIKRLSDMISNRKHSTYTIGRILFQLGEEMRKATGNRLPNPLSSHSFDVSNIFYGQSFDGYKNTKETINFYINSLNRRENEGLSWIANR